MTMNGDAAFTLMLRDSHRKCDQVVRTLFKGTVLGVDEWEAMCRNRHLLLVYCPCGTERDHDHVRELP